MIKNNKKIIMVLIFLVLALLLIPSKVQAVGLQANKGGTPLVNTNVNDFFDSIRQMEDEHGTLGTPEKEGGNGIDCHMVKNTEWGTALMLTASRYGKVPTTGDSAVTNSTTGNNSGVFQMRGQKWDITTGFYNTANGGNVTRVKAVNKYWNNYGTGTNIAGDSFGITNGWQNATNNQATAGNEFVSCRGDANNIFSLGRSGGGASSTVATRAVVVCGPGL